MRTPETVKAEIVAQLGFFPPFFEPAMGNPAILDNLWQQMRAAYLENPLPALFKEKLAAILARYCPVAYCLVCHTSALRPLGLEASKILALLKRPLPDVAALERAVSKVRSQTPDAPAAWPQEGSDLEQTILDLAVDIFRSPEGNAAHHAFLREFLSPSLYNHLILFLAYNKTALGWAEAHPEISYEADQRARDHLAPLVKSEPGLAEFLRDYRTHFQTSSHWRLEQKALRKTEKLFKFMVESVLDYAIILIDLDGRITEWNIGAERLLGYTEAEVVGKSLELFFTPEDRAAGRPGQELATARATGHARDERFHLRKDGARLWVKGFMTAVKSEDGALQAYAKIMQDLTDRKKVEDELARWNEELEQRVEKRTQELAHSQNALLQAQKLEAVGQLAGGVAHDFNNLITGILGMSEELKSSFESGDPRLEDIDEIIKASNRAFGVTRQLLAFGRRQITQPRVLEVKTVVGDLHKLLHRILGEDIEIRLHSTEKGRIKIDQGQLEQILLNLAINARDAMPRGGTLTIQTADVELYDGDSQRHFQVAAGPYVMLEVSDTGHGMSQDVLAHIFEPFFTTKEKDRGTGLGLATVYGIIKQNSGDVHVYSEPGIGTSFKIYFPQDPGERLAGAPKDPAAHSAQGQETVLVVEDEDIVRRVVVKRLRQHGYCVLEARNGKEALQLAENENPIDLLITDVVMPGMTGKDLVEKMGRLRPGLPTLFMSGYPEEIIAHRGIVVPGINFIEKSRIATDLAGKVRDVIEKTRAAAK